MSIVIIGGNERMACLYKNACSSLNCKAKIFTNMSSNLKEQIGTPDLLILFTNTVSHKMVCAAVQNTDKTKTVIARSHSSSLSALKSLLNQHITA